MAFAVPLFSALLALNSAGIEGADAPSAPPSSATDADLTWEGKPLRIQWRKDVGRSIVTDPLLLPDALVVVTSDRRLLCLDLETGEKRWNRKFKEGLPLTPAWSGQSGKEERLFFFLGNRRGELRAVYADHGGDAWSLKFPSLATHLVASEGHLWVLEASGRLTCRASSDGKEEWSFGRLGWDPPDFHLEGDTIYALARRDSLFALDASSGKVHWAAAPGGFFAAPPSLLDSTLVATNVDGRLSRYDPETGAFRGGEQRTALQLSRAILTSGRILTAASSGIVEARSPERIQDGWRRDLGLALAVPPVEAGPVVLVSALNGKLFALRSEAGEQTWSMDLPGGLRVAPILTPRFLILATGEGDVYVYSHEAAVDEG